MPGTPVTRRTFLRSASLMTGAALVGSPQGFMSATAAAQDSHDEIGTALKLPLQTEEVVEFQLREYLMKRVPALPSPKTAAEWTAEQERLRNHLLERVIFRGWPKTWLESPPNFEDLGFLPSGKGYRLRKLRYEIVPGFRTTALLYEPESPMGRVPATINLNGHAPNGKQATYKQKRCINNALQGMFALSLEWLGMGELAVPENNHWNGAHLSFVGASATGLFYLAIRKGLDFLCQHPNVDAHRIGATGLSGGAWQTIIISALDPRIAAAVPVAGYFSFTSAIERNSDVGDMEYHPPDLFSEGGDYSTLTAMLAPRPIMLIYGAVDEYGLRAPLQKPHLYDDLKPFFALYGQDNNLAWHENVNPGTHNYDLDNRQQSYAFFTKHFKLPVVEKETPVDAEVKSYDQLVVGVPKDNLTIISLARQLADKIQRAPIPADLEARSRWEHASRARLKDIVRYRAVTLKHAWPLFSNKNDGVDSLGYRFDFSNELSATAVSLKATTASSDAPLVIFLDDAGRPRMASDGPSSAAATSDAAYAENGPRWHIDRGAQVLAVDLIFTGDASPDRPKNEPTYVPALYRELLSSPAQLPGVIGWLKTRPPSALYGLLLSANGDRALGMQAAQLLEIASWLRKSGSAQISLRTSGIRSQITALVASALEPAYFSEVITYGGMKSLKYLLDNAVPYQDAPDLFCLDLYKYFDVNLLASLSHPTKVAQTFLDEHSG